jgi:hypothetical protein
MTSAIPHVFLLFYTIRLCSGKAKSKSETCSYVSVLCYREKAKKIYVLRIKARNEVA